MAKTKLLNNMISAIEADAYRRGFNEGLRAAMRAVKGLRPTAQQEEPEGSNGADQPGAPLQIPPKPPRQLRENSDQMRVLKAIQSTPGMRGVEILRALEGASTPVHERTLRTALSRLKRHHLIEQREERWYEIPSASHAK